MEVSGVVLRPSPCFSGAGFDTQSSKLSFCSMSKNGGELKLSNHPLRSRKLCTRVSSLGFSDSGHVQYYVSPKAGLKEKEKKQKKDSETKTLKKKLKLVKGMSKDLLRFSSMGFGIEVEDGLLAEVKGKSISEATEILLAQLHQLKAEEKELKRKKKEEKAKLKAARIESSSSSSESSDGEGGEAIDMSSLRAGVITAEPKSVEVPSAQNMIEDRINLNAEASTRCRSENNVMVAGSAGRIEVCMGGKCKKSGAPALLEEFQQRVGVEGAVVGCRCMGKCRDAPNVRVVNQIEDQSNPLCLGVGLDDVGVIVSNFFGGESQELGLMVV